MNAYEELKSISNYKSVCLIGHTSPDADAIASMLVLKSFLNNKFNISHVDIFAECIKPTYGCQVLLGDVKLNPNPIDYDVAIMLDSPNIERLGIYKSLFEKSKLKVVIDHHQTNLYQGDINIVENFRI